MTALNWPPLLLPAEPERIVAARRLLGAGPDTFVIGFLARFHRIKRADLLIAAYRKAASPNTILALIGDGPERARLEAKARGDGSIRFLGHREDIGVWHRAINLFALTSDWEGMPLGVLEAMQLGTPIIATACLGTAEAPARQPCRAGRLGDLAGRRRRSALPAPNLRRALPAL